MIKFRIFLFIVIFLTRYCNISADTIQNSSSAHELHDYMQNLKQQADKEGDISLSAFGSDKFAQDICRSQNFAERGHFIEAATILEGLVIDNIASDWRQMLNKRIEILKKWAAD